MLDIQLAQGKPLGDQPLLPCLKPPWLSGFARDDGKLVTCDSLGAWAASIRINFWYVATGQRGLPFVLEWQRVLG